MLHDIVPNFRDLGGTEGPGGHRLPPQRVFRSSALVQTPGAVTSMLEASLPTAAYFDLRTDAEIRRDGAPDLPPAWTLRHIPVYDFDLGQPIATKNFPEAHRRYLRVVSSIASQAVTTPVIVACSLGKDRTGFVIALLLHWLDVPRDQIMDDYRLSDARLADARPRLAKHWRDPRNHITPVDVNACTRFLDFAATASVPPSEVTELARTFERNVST